MSTIVCSDETLFFCFGQPKSGTTLLQRMLDSHPDVSCPSEHQFNFLLNNMSSMLESYNQLLRLVDGRTGGQGASFVDKGLQKKIFRCTVETILRDAAEGKKVYGANDNAIMDKLDMYGDLFDSPRMIVIFRNPADAGISAWHHNLRLGKEENAVHKKYVMQYGGFEGWMEQYARWFNNAVMLFSNYSVARGNTLLVRYEDIQADKPKQLERLFSFLGVDCGGSVIDNIVANTEFSAMRNQSGDSGFFRCASSQFGEGELDNSLRKRIAEISEEGLIYIGYDVISKKLLPMEHT